MMMIIVIKKIHYSHFSVCSLLKFSIATHLFPYASKNDSVGKLLDCFQIPLGRGTQEFFMRK